MKFCIVTQDYSGLGWALRLKDEGHKVLIAYQPKEKDSQDKEVMKSYLNVGNGLVQKFPLKKIFEKRDKMRDWYWVWDGNHNVEENEALRKEKFKVFGGGKWADTMEHDRNACLKFANKYGLKSPPSFPFTDTKTAIGFAEANEETAYVYKPDEGENFETWVPESEEAVDANKELCTYLQSVENKPFILQERKDGVETNVEVWFVKGEPKFAFMDIECKKRINNDLGEMVGCAFDYAWEIPLDSESVKQTIGKLYPAYKQMNYTGFSDANFIAAKDGIWFFEKCERFGYNAHPNLLFSVNRDPLGQTLASLVDGNFKPNFSPGFGSSITMATRDGAQGDKAIQFPEKILKDVYFWDVYKKDDLYLTAGYDSNILIVTGFGYTIQTAWENVLAKANLIKFPYRQHRTDGDKTDYPSSPVRRYEALKAMKLI